MLRFDDFRLDASGVKDLADGSIRVVGQLTRTGIFTYKNPDGTPRREYRPAEEVFRTDSLATFAGATITINHPAAGTNGKRLVQAGTWKRDAVGHLGDNIREDKGFAVGDLYIKDPSTVAAVKSGAVKHISLGYELAYDPTPGTTPEGERYDGVQRSLRGNHVALLSGRFSPRGGAECAIRLDANDDELAPREDGVPGPGVEYTSMTPEQILALQNELKQARTDAAELPAVRAALVVALAQPTAMPEERIDALVAERADVLAAATVAGVPVKDKDGKSLSNLAIKRAMVAKHTPALAARCDSFSAETVDAVLAAQAAQPHPSLKTAVAVVLTPGPDAVRTDAAATPKLPTISELQEKSNTALRNAWKN